MINDDFTAAFLRHRDDSEANAAEEQLFAERPEEREALLVADASDVIKDVSRGITEMPGQIVRGARNAVQETIDFTLSAGDWLEKKFPITPGYEAPKEGEPETRLQLPEPVGPADSVTGGLVADVTQFLTGFFGAGKLKLLKNLQPTTKIGQAGKMALQGSLADFVAMDPHEDKLSDIVQKYPKLANPVTEFLAAKPDDNEATLRLKRAVEGAGLGVVVDGFVLAASAIRSARRARAQARIADPGVPAPKLRMEQTMVLGDPNGKLVRRVEAPPKPVRGFHGTKATVEQVPDATSLSKSLDLGPHFSVARETAEIFANDGKTAGRVLEADLHFKKVLDIGEDLAGWSPWNVANKLDEMGLTKGKADDKGNLGELGTATLRAAEEARRAGGGSEQAADAANAVVKKWLQGEGYDAVKYTNTFEGKPADAFIALDMKKVARPGETLNAKTAAGADATRGMKPKDVGSTTAEHAEKPGVYINFARMDAPEDIQRTVKQMADWFKSDIDEARRGVRTWEQTKLSASQVDAFDTLMKRRTGEPLNAEQSVAVRELWASSGTKLTEVAGLAAREPSEANLVQFRKMLATHYAIQQEVIAARTETARALNAWKIPAGAPDVMLRQMETLLEQSGGADVARKMAERVAALSSAGMTREVEKMVEGSVFAKTRDAVAQVWINSLLSNPATHVVNAVSNWTVIAQQIGERKVAEGISAALGTADGVAAGEAVSMMGAVVSGFKDAMRAAWKTAKTGETSMGMRKGEETVRPGALSAGAWNVASDTWLGRSLDMVNAITQTPGRALATSDEFFKSIGYRMELHAQATRTAKAELDAGTLRAAEPPVPPGMVRMYHGGTDNSLTGGGSRWFSSQRTYAEGYAEMRGGGQGKLFYVDVPEGHPAFYSEYPEQSVQRGFTVNADLEEEIAKNMREVPSGDPAQALKARTADIIANPPENIQLEAMDAALYQTFTQRPAEVLKRVADSVQNVPVLGLLIMPFKNTPINLLTYAAERSPMAPLVKAWREDVEAGGARADLAVARMATGSLVMLSMIDAAMEGRITGKGPTRGPERQQWMREGNQEYSVKVGDRWFAFNRLDPIGMTIGMGADIAAAIVNADKSIDKNGETYKAMEEAVISSMFAVAKNAMSKTYMTGVAQFFDALSDPDRHGERWVERLAGSVVPAGVANVARQVDPYMRSAQTVMEAMQKRTPYFSEDLPMYRDLWGRPVDYRSGFGTAYDMLSPVYTRKYGPLPIDAELGRLEYFPTMPEKKVDFNGVTINLEDYPHAYERYVELAGNGAKHPAWGLTALEFLNAVVQGQHPLSEVYKLYSDGPNGGKADFVRNTLAEYRKLARAQVLEEFYDVQAEYDVKRKQAPYGNKFAPALFGQ